MIPTYPSEAFQHYLDQWWIEDDGKDLCRGRLIRAFVPHVDQVPFGLIPKGRTEARRHDLADCEILPIQIDGVFPRDTLPVAGLTCHPGEIRTVYRAKRRPMLVLALAGQTIPAPLTRGYPAYQTSATHIAAPYYGGNADGKRAGFHPEFLDRIRRCEFPQFSWDTLPIDGALESVLRLDHIQPISTHYKAFETTNFRLSKGAVAFMDAWLEWHISAIPPSDESDFGFLRNILIS